MVGDTLPHVLVQGPSGELSPHESVRLRRGADCHVGCGRESQLPPAAREPAQPQLGIAGRAPLSAALAGDPP